MAERLVGRAAELSRLRDFLAHAASVGGTCLLVGDAGVGKTMLLDKAADEAAGEGTSILRAAGAQFEADVSYSILNQLLLPVSDQFEHLRGNYAEALAVALGIGDGPAPPRLVLLNATISLLRQLATAGPVLLIVDDLPWLDHASALLLSSVARRLRGTRVGFLGASRTGSEGFFERASLPELKLEPLDEAAAADLLTSRFPTLPARIRRRVLEESGGNPLALTQLPAALTSSQQDTLSVLPVVTPLTGRLQTLFTDRVAGLPPATKALLLRTVLDGTGDLRVLQAMVTTPVVDDLAAAEGAQLVTVDRVLARIVFRHPLMRSAVIGDSTEEERRAAHRELAAFLYAEPERRAWHLAEAATAPDEDVAALLELASHRTLQRGDTIGAASAMTRAAALSPARRDQSRRLAAAAYLGAHMSGELRSASQLLQEAQRLDPEMGESLHAVAAAMYVLVNGDGDMRTAYRLVADAVESGSHGFDATDDGLNRALNALLLVCFWLGRPEPWDRFYALLDRLTPEVPELLYLQSRVFPDPARTTAAVRERFVEVVSDIDAERDPSRITRINVTAAYLDLLPATRESAWRLVRDGRQGGAAGSSQGGLMYLCIDDFFGRWDEAQRLADEGLALCRTDGYSFVTWYFLYHRSLLAAVRGDDSAAREWAAEHMRVTELRAAHGATQWAQHPLTLTAIARGDYEAAYQHASSLSPPGVFAPFKPHAVWVGMELVEAAVRTHRFPEAKAHAALMGETDLFRCSPRLALVAAGSAAVADQTPAALEQFEHALGLADADQWPFDYARIQLLYGERLRRARRSVAARDQLNAALATLDRLGARPWAEQARRELRAAGETRHRDAGPTLGVLTAQELEIAQLAAEGLTNRQIADRLFLSHRTVGAHLYRLYPKLGITSRAALRDALTAADRD